MSRRRHATLSERDGDDLDFTALDKIGGWDPTSGLPTRGGSKTEGLRTLGQAGCWCGASYNHDWPGKSEGEPHPRSSAWGRMPKR